MKISPSRRAYRLGVRAEAAEANAQRILAAFMGLMREHWFDEITLEAVAQGAGVTVQTVIRRFGGKDGLLEAARDELGREVRERRKTVSTDIEAAFDGLTRDYEAEADLVLRLLAQEARYPAIKAVCDFGRADHREWVSEVFAAHLEGLTPAQRTDRIDALIIVTDVFTWKLLRRDMKHSREKYRAQVIDLARRVLQSTPPQAARRGKP